MNLLLFLKNRFKDDSAFTLLEVILVITISTVLAGVFLNLLLGLYADQAYFTAYSKLNLDAYLLVDIMAEQLKYAQQIDLISEREVQLFAYYNGKEQWISYNLQSQEDGQTLARGLGGEDYLQKDFKRNLSLLENVQSLEFKYLQANLLELSLVIEADDQLLELKRLVQI
ncbi:prepilin-type N-terminal cleavage/methylation domain-containing protein [Halanaerobium sp. Z-7514]|uniref:Prepilin-type N-terminal cleavage/methylation domain-containing protein n=1 Tax=Halanaerobium polyolivorans TaxID=2886943 RepID=A0AAW4WY56_9FIRM|nr:prepilin-type N-terminal cleavage/methylation domain-containing protein [Halanaerobium polyolivorans]MCC3143752.1 prepilin-type N-terminal cleavage/methylation domain-containing protein [Halanaerobium polyolivorans]